MQLPRPDMQHTATSRPTPPAPPHAVRPTPYAPRRTPRAARPHAPQVYTPTWADEEEEEQQLRQLAEQLGLPAGLL